jgi:hypothetical protein
MTLMIHHDAMNDLRLVEPGPTAQAGPWGATSPVRSPSCKGDGAGGGVVGLTRRRCPRSGGTGRQGRAVKPARKATAEGEATAEQ